MYSYNDVLTYINEADVKFIRLVFIDIYGKQKNISIISDELKDAFQNGIKVDASKILGYKENYNFDLFLFPDPTTLSLLPWRPQTGRVIKLFCDIKKSLTEEFELDCRSILKKAEATAIAQGFNILFKPEMDFYLFKMNEEGEKTKIPYDKASYMDISPEDKGENIRREICLTLLDMDILPENSHHEVGPGQNKINLKYNRPLVSADDTSIFKWVARNVSSQNGLFADFDPKPLENENGNSMLIDIKVDMDSDRQNAFIAGILNRIKEFTLFLNPKVDSYERLQSNNTPKYIKASSENGENLIKTIGGELKLRSPDPSCNPYIAYALLIYAGLEGIALNENLESYDQKNIEIPQNIFDAVKLAKNSNFIKTHLPAEYILKYCK